MVHDRLITIAVGVSRKDTHWKTQQTTVEDLYEHLATPIRSTETLEDYLKLKKAQQDDLKDVGGFIAGGLNGPRRKASAVTGRDIVTLDFDTIPPYGTQSVLDALNGLGCGYCVYSTRKHMDTAPRLRLLLPLDRTVTVDEYEPIARRLAERIGIQMADATTFEASRLMYWPSCCQDSTYVYETADAPMVSADEVLGSYTNWRDWNSWPQVPGAISYQKLAVRQGDPESKTGIVGAFNRTYPSVTDAMEAFLPGVYESVDGDPHRMTYLGGSTTGGAVIYDDGKFLFSHHATDPCSGRLVNSFDLVRLHKFGHMDEDAAPDTPVNRLQSYQAMCELAAGDKATAARVAQERREQAVRDFEGVAPTPGQTEDDTAWLEKLELKPKSTIPKSTIDNIRIILENDPFLKGKFALNQFAGRGEVLGVLPWDQHGTRRLWSDTDSNGLYWYLERYYSISGRGNIDAALDIHASTHAFNEVQDYLRGIQWDGAPRLDTLFVEYLGAEDNAYNRAVCRKSFVGAVARAMEPGCKHDTMLILCGAQGLGKSTLLDKMSRGWFNDSIRSFEGKEASELLQGVWLVEVAELDAFRRTDVARIKQFLSLRADRYRAAYGRNVKELPRCCVFFGTCNQMDFLQDTTGNRRFWPVDVGLRPHAKTVWRDLTADVIDQIWAEAKMRWQLGEATYLTGDVEKMAQEMQERHREASPKEGLIQDFVTRQVPSDWAKWSIDRRRDFWAQTTHGDIELVDRDRICAIEVWCELFGGNPRDIKNTDTREINAVLRRLSGWTEPKTAIRSGPYPQQRGFLRDR
jgi:predicted P-loop ATPase